jgi:hypothetical protein
MSETLKPLSFWFLVYMLNGHCGERSLVLASGDYRLEDQILATSLIRAESQHARVDANACDASEAPYARKPNIQRTKQGRPCYISGGTQRARWPHSPLLPLVASA